MGHETFDELYQRLGDVLDAGYRDDVQRNEAVMECMERTMMALLEKLRDHDTR